MPDDQGYLLSLEHAGIPGIIFSSLVSCVSMFYIVGTIVSVTWKLPQLTVKQTRALMTPNRRMVLISFLLSMILMDFMSIHAWRILSGDGACIPSPDWFLLWTSVVILNTFCLITAWLHPPYSLVMIHTSVVSSAYMVLYYLFTCLARNQFCGSMFVAIPSMITGVINIFMVPTALHIPMEDFESLHEVVGKTIARITHGPVAKDKDSVSVYLSPHDDHDAEEEDEEEGGYSRNRRFGMDFESVSLSTPRRNKSDANIKKKRHRKKSIKTVRGGTIPRKWRPSTRRSMSSKSVGKRRIEMYALESDDDDEEWSSTSMMQASQVYLDDGDAYVREYTEDAESSQSQ